MSKIEELLKNEKVEWKKLECLLDYEQPSKYIVKSTEYADEYDTPVLTAGQTFILGYTNEKDNIYVANKNNPVIIFDDFTAGNHWVDFNFKVKSSAMKMLKPKEGVNLRYCYHFIQTIKVDTTEHKRLWISKYSQIQIPIPSIETQEKIVETLDKFTNYVTELQAELQDRTKQYEYYRDMLLSEEYLNKITAEIMSSDNKVKVTTLGECVNIVVGGDVPKDNFSPTKTEEYQIPIFSNGIEEKSLYGYTNIAKVVEKSVTVSARGTIGYVSYKETPYFPIVRLLCLIPKKEIEVKYLYYFLQKSKINHKETGIPSLTTDMLKKIKIILPTIEFQNKIVEILDKFQSLLADTKGLLPQEIEQRQKQYEYYREKLLTFDENSVKRERERERESISL